MGNTTLSKVEGWSNPCIPAPLARGKATVTLYHMTSPTCWWSWGYYGTLGRVRLTYGDQVDLRLLVMPVYEDREQYLRDYKLTMPKFEAWAKESQAKMGVEIATNYTKNGLPQSVVQPVLASLAAYRQGQPKGDRFVRELSRRFIIEARDVNKADELLAAAAESDLDVARFQKDLKDEKWLQQAMHDQQHSLPHLPLGFYNLALADARARTVVLDHAYDPADVVGAIEFLTEGKLVKNIPTDPVAFLRATGPAPEVEIARAFGWGVTQTSDAIARGIRDGTIERVTLGGIALVTAAH